ncbi:tyrosine-type recombinase/integrase [Runella sp.]|uniref:site-specific integrase n=1 Tax=Runella sp. TaxID=1960881 RepID=UPI003D0FDC18
MRIVIRFRIRTKKNAPKDAMLYIYVRLRLNGVAARSDMATGVGCLHADWDNKAQRIRGHSESARQQNAKLTQIRDDIDAIYNELRKYDKPISAEILKQAYTTKQDPTPRTLLYYYRKYIDEVKADEVKGDTLDCWHSRYNTVEKYIIKSLKRKDVELTEITGQWLMQYVKYHKSLGNSKTHSARAVASIKAMLDWTVVESVLPFNCTLSYKPKRDKPKPIKFLSQEQLSQLANCTFYDDRLQKVVDCFLVQAYTGMAYNEILNFNKRHIKIDKETEWIMIYRNKSTELSSIPVFVTTKALLEKYNYKLPVISNQKMNDFIKEAATVAGLENAFEISTHVARKTAGMYLLNAGLRIESVSKILGHKSVKVTERHYATLLTSGLADDLRKNGLI